MMKSLNDSCRSRRRRSTRRAAALGQVAAADAEVRDMQRRADAAAAVESQLREEWRRVNAEYDDLRASGELLGQEEVGPLVGPTE